MPTWLKAGTRFLSAAALVVLVAAATAMSTQIAAAAMAKRSRDCSQCHTTPPALNDRGRAVKAKRKKLRQSRLGTVT